MRARRFQLLLVEDGGRRLRRINVPLWVARTTLVVAGLGTVALGLALVDYRALRTARSEIAAHHRDVKAHEHLVALVAERLAELRTETARWPELHAAIMKPFGPSGRGPGARGVGGPATPLAPPRDGGDASIPEQLADLLASLREEGRQLQALGRFAADAGRVMSALPTRWPLGGAVNSEFGRRRSPWSGEPEFHGGIDIAAEPGTPVKAPAPGTVVFAGAVPDFGNTVVLDHGQDVSSRFAHLQKLKVAPGQRVDRGQMIALSGSSGRSTGPHLHYEVLVRGRPIDPRRVIWDRLASN
jgi:murein DD-endopeptidase MepM/ murein hydrolase activator NlpD